MALNARDVPSSGPRAPVLDEGAYPARLVGVIDLGLQPQEYQGESKPPKNEILTIYESSDEFMPDENGDPDESKPRWFWEEFSLNHLDSDRAKSTKRYYALDPNEEAEGDWSKLLGRPVIVALTRTKGKKGVEYNNIGGTSSMRPKEAAKLPELVNEPRFFDLSDPDVEVFLSLPERVQKKIKENLEYEGSLLEKRLANYKKEEKDDEKEERPTEKTTSRGKRRYEEPDTRDEELEEDLNNTPNDEEDW